MTFGLGIVQVNVTDLAEARRFYGTVLGLPLREPFGPDGPFELELGPGPVVLVYRVSKSAPPGYPEQTGVTVAFRTADIVATVTAWRARGVEFVPIAWSPDRSGIANCPYGRFIAFRDPFGNVHELIEPGTGQRPGQAPPRPVPRE
jgi:catechol 2,3-dioxygenase-like lactoylglutathione lyase family enzyme